MTMDTMIGVDLAKHVFQMHGSSMSGHVQFQKKLSRTQFSRFMGKQQPCVVVMEACGRPTIGRGRCAKSAAIDGLIDCADPVVAAQQLTSHCSTCFYMPRLLGIYDQLTPEQIEEDALSVATTFLRAYAVRPVG